MVPSHIWGPRPNYCYCQRVAVLSMWVALSEERTGLSFTAARIRSTCHLYLQFYMSAFYTFSCRESGSLGIPAIYSCTCNCSIYICMHIIVARRDPLLGSDSETDNETTSPARQETLNKQIYAGVTPSQNRFPRQKIHTQQLRNCWKWCLLRGPCRNIISRAVGALNVLCNISRRATTWAQKLKNLHC
jgi:hypothetical protein